MPKITMTTFVDFVSATSTGRITCVRNAKAFYADPTPYELRSFYLLLKTAISKCFEADGDKLALDDAVANLADAKKARSYSANVKGMKTWMGRKQFEWLGTSKKLWSAHGLTVSVNPELRVRMNGSATVIKLHLKADPLTKRAIDPMLHLLTTTHGAEGSVGILDVRNSKLIVPTRTVPDIDALLRAEAASFALLWDSV